MSKLLVRNKWWQLGLLCLWMTGCAGPRFRTAQGEEIDFVVLEGDAPPDDPGLVGGKAAELSWSDLNSSPIHVWVYRNAPGGPIQRLRVTGHAVEQYCAEASKALIEFHQKHQVVSGFLTFGVDDSYPAGSMESFSREAEALLKKLRPLSLSAPDQVVIHEVKGPADVIFSQEPPPIMATGVGSVLGRQPFTGGPAFVPVRAWSGGGPAQPLRFELQLADLGLTADQLDQLASDVDVGPWVEQAEMLKESAHKMELLTEARRASSEFTDNVWVYRLHRSGYTLSLGRSWPSAIAQVRMANSRMRTLLRKYQVIEAIDFLLSEPKGPGGKKKRGLSAKQKEGIRSIQKALSLNESCLERLERRIHCVWDDGKNPGDGSFVDVEFMEEDDPRERGFLTNLIRELQDMSEAELMKRRQGYLEALEKLTSNIVTIQRRRVSGELKAGRERVIDGLLRGWPLPASSDDEAIFADSFSENQMPAIWQKLLARIQDTQGADLREEGRAAGQLQRSNVFFRIQELAPGRYEVQPMYVIWDAYAEVWDTGRRTVTIETPFGQPLELAENEPKKETQP